MTYRSTPSFAAGGVQPTFACIVCGKECGGHHILEVRAICCTHMDGEHDYEDGYCLECGEEKEYDYCDTDVPIFGGRDPGEPIGVPAGSLNGNAAARHDDPGAWSNWLAFCARNGHP